MTDEPAFVCDEEVFALGVRASRAFLPDASAAVPVVVADLVARLLCGAAGSLVRVGDGEGNALGLTMPEPEPAAFRAFDERFYEQNGTVLNRSDALQFCSAIRDAIVSSDIVGFRTVERHPAYDERAVIRSLAEAGDEKGARGLLAARQFLVDGLHGGTFAETSLVGAWIYIALVARLDELTNAAHGVVVITGREELRPAFEARLGDKLEAFIAVPPEGARPCDEAGSHFGREFPRVLEYLQRDLRGVLVLAGAGFFGKIYVARARARGAVAVDIGSGFDLLAGVKTRPIHRFVDTSGLGWLGDIV